MGIEKSEFIEWPSLIHKVSIAIKTQKKSNVKGLGKIEKTERQILPNKIAKSTIADVVKICQYINIIKGKSIRVVGERTKSMNLKELGLLVRNCGRLENR